MKQSFFEDLSIAMYPSALLHTYGVNGKISGSIGAIGEMQEVLPIIHGPRGCGFHYRYSARRRHQPFYRVLTSNLEENEIIRGGEAKLRRAIISAWETYHPKLILVVPSPVSDILNEDIQAVTSSLREKGIPVAGIHSELFSHRDKNYTRSRLKQMANQKVSGDGRLEMELKGCGFTEALYALVEDVMEPVPVIPRSVNIETVGWGTEGNLALHEIAGFLGKCGITVNTWIPSAPLEELKKAPAAQLNLAKRVRWARHMKEKFGTEYIHLGGAGRYSGLEGICNFYRDIGEALGLKEEMDAAVEEGRAKALEDCREAREQLAKRSCILVSRSIQQAPFHLRQFALDYGIPVRHLCIVLTDEERRNMDMTAELEEKLLGRVREAAELYSPSTQLWLNPDEDKKRELFAQADVLLGTNDMTFENHGIPVVPEKAHPLSLSFESYVRSVNALWSRVEHACVRTDLLLQKMPLSDKRYPLYANRESLAAREMWNRMWLRRKEEV